MCPGTEPTTYGIWSPLSLHKLTPDGPNVLLLDTEGFAAVDNTPDIDAKIFAITSLLSTKLLYNKVGVVNTRDMEYLELLARYVCVRVRGERVGVR